MATTTIPWGDGSGDNIYLTYPSASGDQTVEVSSDANTGAARSKVVTFTSSVGNITQVLTVSQETGLVIHTLSVNPYAVDADHQYYSITGPSGAYDAETTSSNCSIGLTRGTNAETYVYFKFNTSALPENATIVSVTMKTRVSTSTGSNTYLPTRQVQACSGTTLKGTPTSVTTNTQVFTLNSGTWTREELNDARFRVYMVRGTSRVNNGYNALVYGGTLTIEYTVPA